MSKPHRQVNFAICGGGIAGLASAFALLSSGHKVSLFEQKQELSELGAGIQLSPNATSILAEWQLLEEIKSHSNEAKSVHFMHWQKGYQFAQFPISDEVFAPYLHIRRAELSRSLAKAIHAIDPTCIQLNHKLTHIYEHPDHCALTFNNDDTIYHCDYVIGADGIRSKVKELLFPEAESGCFSGNIAWRGLIPTEKLSYKPPMGTHLIPGPNAHIVFYYLENQKYLNYVAVKEVESQRTLEESWGEKGQLSQLLKDFDGWHPQWLSILNASDPEQCFNWPLFDRKPLKNWSSPRALLIGDAAHPVLPFLAQGAAMAIEDAFVLQTLLNKPFLASDQTKPGAPIQNPLAVMPLEQLGQHFYQLRIERCSKVLKTSQSNRHIYHFSNGALRLARDLSLSMLSKTLPNFLANKLSWLYKPEFLLDKKGSKIAQKTLR